MHEGLFTQVLPLLRDGQAVRELSEQLAECVAQSRLHGKPASLTLKLTVTPEGSTGEYTIAEHIQTKLPTRTRETLLQGTPEGNLEPVPHQADMHLEPAPLRALG